MWINFEFEQFLNVHKFWICTIFESEQFFNMNKMLNWNNFEMWTNFELEQFSNMDEPWNWTIFKYKQILNWNIFCIWIKCGEKWHNKNEHFNNRCGVPWLREFSFLLPFHIYMCTLGTMCNVSLRDGTSFSILVFSIHFKFLGNIFF